MIPTFSVLEIMAFPYELLSHLEGVRLQLWGWRLAPGCPACCGGQSAPVQLCKGTCSSAQPGTATLRSKEGEKRHESVSAD